MTDYAFRIIRTIEDSPTKLVTSEEIAKKEALTPGTIIKILRILSDNGIVESHRGRGGITGGFTLTKTLKSMSFLSIIEIMEGKVEINPSKDIERECCKSGTCSLHKQLEAVTEEVRAQLNTYGLDEVLYGDDKK